MAFDIAAAFGDIARTDGRKQIKYIPLHLIDTNPRNYYSTDGIESLAANIQMFGLMEPLIVKTTGSGRYMLISGHRRRLALRMNAEAAENYPESMSEPVPCIVEDAAAPVPGIEDPEKAKEARALAEELKLIYANADTRVMSSADTAQQVRRTRELLIGLRDLGYDFPGKMRDHVAAASHVSATRVARLDVIDKRLTEPSLRRAWKDGSLGETTAYEIARRGAEIQKLTAARVTAKVLASMSTESVTTILDACEADGNRDRETAAEWNRSVGTMADAAGNATGHNAGEYLDKLHREDANYRRCVMKAANSIFRELSQAPKMTGQRNDDIAEVRTQLKHTGSYNDEYNFTGTPKGAKIGSNTLHIGAVLRTWPAFYDVLAAIAINRCVEQAAEATKPKPEKVSGPDTGIQLQTGTPAAPGEYMTRIGVGSEETKQAATWQRLEWHSDGTWCFPKTGTLLPKGTKVFRWFKLPEV